MQAICKSQIAHELYGSAGATVGALMCFGLRNCVPPTVANQPDASKQSAPPPPPRRHRQPALETYARSFVPPNAFAAVYTSISLKCYCFLTRLRRVLPSAYLWEMRALACVRNTDASNHCTSCSHANIRDLSGTEWCGGTWTGSQAWSF